MHDLIIEVNDQSLENLNHFDSVNALIRCGNKVKLKLIRFHDETPQAKCLKMLHEQVSCLNKITFIIYKFLGTFK